MHSTPDEVRQITFTSAIELEPNGAEIAQRLQALDATLPVVLFTGHGDAESADLADSTVAEAVIQKPFDRELLLATLERLIGAASS